MKYISSLFFYIFLVLWTLVICSLGLMGLVLRCGNFVEACGRMWARVLVSFLRVVCGIKVNVKGAENIPSEACIIASKHQSVWETIFLFWYIKKSKFVLKEQLTKIPFFGQYVRALGMISVDRLGGVGALRKMIKCCVKELHLGNKVALFPEGTRVGYGEKVKLKGGVYELHKQAPEFKVIPVYLNSGKVWPAKSLVIGRGEIDVVFKKPIQGILSKKELLDKIHKSINYPSNG